MCRQAKVDYEKEVQHSIELHSVIAAGKAEEKYKKHYNLCNDVSSICYFLSTLFLAFICITDVKVAANFAPMPLVNQYF